MFENKQIGLPMWQGQEGEGRCQVALTLLDTGQGINGLLTGGEQPHIGGVVLALPRLSLSGEGWSSDIYMTPVPGHKDVIVAQTVAAVLARELQIPVVITAGIHSDNLIQDELKQIVSYCEVLTQAALKDLAKRQQLATEN